DGHRCMGLWWACAGSQAPAATGAGCPSSEPGCPGYKAPQQSSGCGFLGLGCALHGIASGGDWLNQQATNLLGGIVNGVSDTINFLGTPFRWLGTQLFNSMPTGVTPSGQLTFTNHATGAAAQSPWNIGNPNAILYKAGYYGWPLLFPPSLEEDL